MLIQTHTEHGCIAEGHPTLLDLSGSQMPAQICTGEFAELLVCKGPCLRAFHPACLGMPQPADMSPGTQAAWFCPECLHGRVRCFVCGEFGAGFEDPTVRKCSLGVCGRFYHIRYALHSPAWTLCPMHLACSKHCRATCLKKRCEVSDPAVGTGCTHTSLTCMLADMLAVEL